MLRNVLGSLSHKIFFKNCQSLGSSPRVSRTFRELLEGAVLASFASFTQTALI